MASLSSRPPNTEVTFPPQILATQQLGQQFNSSSFVMLALQLSGQVSIN